MLRSAFVLLLVVAAWMIMIGLRPAIGADRQAEPSVVQAVKIVGATAGYPPLEVLAQEYRKQDSEVKTEFLPGSQTEGGIVGIKAGLADIGIVDRKLKPGEASELRYREFARDVLVVAVHPSVVRMTKLTSEQLRAIFSGRVRNWREVGGPDGTILVLDRPEDDYAKVLLRRHYLAGEKISSSAVVLEIDGEVAKALQDTPYAIGSISLGYSLSRNLVVNHISLDGVAPTLDNARSGEYPMVRELGLVWGEHPSSATLPFLDYVFSDAGATRLRRAGLLPTLGTE